MALARGWSIDTCQSYINRRYDHLIHSKCCNHRSTRPQQQNPSALGIPWGEK
jgi:hypothetical protein